MCVLWNSTYDTVNQYYNSNQPFSQPLCPCLSEHKYPMQRIWWRQWCSWKLLHQSSILNESSLCYWFADSCQRLQQLWSKMILNQHWSKIWRIFVPRWKTFCELLSLIPVCQMTKSCVWCSKFIHTYFNFNLVWPYNQFMIPTTWKNFVWLNQNWCDLSYTFMHLVWVCHFY